MLYLPTPLHHDCVSIVKFLHAADVSVLVLHTCWWALFVRTCCCSGAAACGHAVVGAWWVALAGCALLLTMCVCVLGGGPSVCLVMSAAFCFALVVDANVHTSFVCTCLPPLMCFCLCCWAADPVCLVCCWLDPFAHATCKHGLGVWGADVQPAPAVDSHTPFLFCCCHFSPPLACA